MGVFKAVSGAFGLILMFLLLFAVIGIGAYAIRWYTAPYKGKLQAREQINSGDYRIAAYDDFFNQCASVQSIEGTIDALKFQLKTAESEKERDRIRTNITGNMAARADAINQYNVDARKSYTRGQFRASDLPFALDPAPYTKGQHTTC